MKLKNNKMIECNKREYAYIKKVASANCLVVAKDIIADHFFWESKANDIAKKDAAYNMIQAVMNNYKYLKVIG